MSKFATLHDSYGQSLWLDYIDRDLLVNGQLRRLIEAGIRGVTSNPTIFQHAISEGRLYDDSIRAVLEADPDADAQQLYQALTVEDVQMAADQLLPLYRQSAGGDGYVSLEVSPRLADDSAGTVDAARQLWRAVDRPNLMVKVPATRAGLPAITTLIGEGINVNVTLLFSNSRYSEVMDAYISGLAKHPDPGTVASVASFFVSRVDGRVDAALARHDSPEAAALRGRVAIANATLAYSRFRERFASDDFLALQARGARVQRPLWASTSTKNPEYRDVLYLESLIGRNTVNTVPPATLEAFEDHGELRSALEGEQGGAEAEQALASLSRLGIDLSQVTDELERDGVAKFADSYDALLELLEQKRAALGSAPVAGV